MQVRPITAEQHLAYISTRSSVSFLQTPAWGNVKGQWRHESLGWFEGEELVGAGLVLLRKVPKISRYLAYLPEGPDLNWENSQDVQEALAALVEYAKAIGVFQVKIGPHAWTRRWSADSLKEAISEGEAKSITQVRATHTNNAGVGLVEQLRNLGWSQNAADGTGFGDYQPRFVFQLQLTNRTSEELLSNFNQQWRRNIRKAEKEGVAIEVGNRDSLPAFHDCYTETAQRDKFTPRSLTYFEKMWDVMKQEAPERIAVYLAKHPDHERAIASTTMTRVGKHAWYSYGASTTAARDLRPSNAIQWAMISDALESGADVYDMRGISDTLDPQNHLFGLIQFKLGTGGYAQEYVGEWDFVISPILAKAFNLYMARR